MLRDHLCQLLRITRACSIVTISTGHQDVMCAIQRPADAWPCTSGFSNVRSLPAAMRLLSLPAAIKPTFEYTEIEHLYSFAAENNQRGGRKFSDKSALQLHVLQ
mmetsp:Transcript_1119/g.2869  ORF Transcript_1119/g.2869 Transcript_1119/m.2869 type:complete len:104 (-) Transcript_1119:109-420(-)